MKIVEAKMPKKLEFLFQPARYKVLYGGRGGAKSHGVATDFVVEGAQKKHRFLCCREFQNSIKESVHKLISDKIYALELQWFYNITQTSITGKNGTEFIFAGIRNNVNSIKSLEGVTKAWVEEAQTVSEDSWKVLIPTIRTEGSEIYVTFNPDQESDPTYRRFVLASPPDAKVVQMSWRDNPWFPEELRREKDYLASVDVDAYNHIWEGQCSKHSAAQIFHGKWTLQHFEPEKEWSGPYFGADWGFANDPTTLVKCWIYERKLYIEQEAYGIGVDIDRTGDLFDSVTGARDHTIRADNARPETISYMQRHGYPKVQSCTKWDGSVEDGIAILRSFESIVIHPRCRHTAEEARLYSYKVDKLTGDILPDIVDMHNHIWDAVRYGLEQIIRNSNMGLFDYYQKRMEEKTEEDALLKMARENHVAA